MIRIYPSLMAADPLNLAQEIQLLESHCAGFHLDIMDNHFVPNITWGASTVNAIAKIGKPVWVHLMIENPMTFYNTLFLPIDSIISFHIELDVDVASFAKIIKEKKHKVSVAINPKTPVSRIVSFLNDIDQVLLMSVEPGFSGQQFLESSFHKIAELVEYRKKYNKYCRIGIDGGINALQIKKLVEMKVDDYAIGSGIFEQKDHVAALKQFEHDVTKK